jgi:hypothetical protein
MEVMASSPLPEIARVLLRFNHVASRRPDTRKQADARVEQQRSRYRRLQRREHTKSE